jgi:hypothetical protein
MRGDPSAYSIGITTFSARYDKYLVNLIRDIRLRIDNDIILAINGDYGIKFDQKYRKKILRLSSDYDNIYPFIYPKFRSLSKMWNEIVINSQSDYILIMNDDSKVINGEFFQGVYENIKERKTSFTINHNQDSFAYFVIKKDELIKLKWFDERFLGIGWEDHEFEKRYTEVMGKEIENARIYGMKTFYDGDRAVIGQKKANGKYSKFNEEMYKRHLSPMQQYPYEKFFLENYHKM